MGEEDAFGLAIIGWFSGSDFCLLCFFALAFWGQGSWGWWSVLPGASFILYELWAGELPVCEKSIPKGSRSGRGISVSAATVSPGVEIWKYRRLLGYVLRSLRDLLGGFVDSFRVTQAATMDDLGILVGKDLGMV